MIRAELSPALHSFENSVLRDLTRTVSIRGHS